MSDLPGTSLLPDWYGIPDELPEAEQEFMRKHRLNFSSGYIGMLRCYRDDPADECRYARTIWQSSSALTTVVAATLAGHGEKWLPEPDQLKEAGRVFLKKAMSLPEEELKKLLDRYVPLF